MRGEKPGTLYVIEADENEIDPDLEQGSPIDPHGADPATVLRFVKSIGSWPAKVVIVACEPETVDDFEIGLSEPVNAAIDKAVGMVEDIIKEIYSETK
jgi:hydrogenase maturation protease